MTGVIRPTPGGTQPIPRGSPMARASCGRDYANAHDANADWGSSLHMGCAWRELATPIDLWHRPAFLTLGLILLIANVVSLAIGDPLMPRLPWRSEQERGWSQRYWITLAQTRRINQWLRQSGRGWIIVLPRLLVAALVLCFAWPVMISPAYCETIVSKRDNRQLKPRIGCLPPSASRWADGRPCKSLLATHEIPHRLCAVVNRCGADLREPEGCMKRVG